MRRVNFSSFRRFGRYVISQMPGYFAGNDGNNQMANNEINNAMIEDSPRIIRLTLWTILSFFIVAVIWSALAHVDEVTRGEGRTIPSSRLQKIQNLEGGIVSQVLVHEGQIVKAGQPLIRLDPTRFASNVGETEADKQGLQARIERLTAEVNDQPLTISDDIKKAVPDIAQGEMELYNSRRSQFQNEVDGLQEQLVQKNQELRDAESKSDQFSHSLALTQQEIKMSEPLIASGAISQVEILRLKRTEVETRGQLDSVKLSIPRLQSAIKEIENKTAEARGRYRSDALTQLNEARTNLNKAIATDQGLKDRVNRTLVTSPVRGIIQQIMANTVGGVIQPGNDIIEIVPLDDTLLVEAKINPRDIAFLHPGQTAMIKFTAYDYTIYGGLKGTVEQISPDTETDKQGHSYYRVQLRTDKNYLGSKEKPMYIMPGMISSVDIITGRKSILSYLLKPIIRANAEALRER